MPWGSLIAPTIILLGALVTDVRSHKIYNKWVIFSVIIALASSYHFFGFEGLQAGAQGAALALLITLPLVILGALGASDMKLLFAFGLAATYSVVFSVVVLSFVWAGVIGIFTAVVRGRGKALAVNTVKLLTAQPRNEKTLLKIPYSTALFLGWIAYVAMAFKHGAFL